MKKRWRDAELEKLTIEHEQLLKEAMEANLSAYVRINSLAKEKIEAITEKRRKLNNECPPDQ